MSKILPVVLYGCKTWSLILNEKRRLWMFREQDAEEIFRPKGEEETGELKRSHNEQPHVFTFRRIFFG